MAQGILINGRRYSYSSIELSLITQGSSSEIFIDVDEISYGDAMEIAFVNGTNTGPIGWTKGTYAAADSTLKMGKSSFQSLVQKIGNGWLGANIQVVLKYADVGEPLVTDRLDARLAGAADSHAYGPEALKTTVTLKVFQIERNGIKPFI